MTEMTGGHDQNFVANTGGFLSSVMSGIHMDLPGGRNLMDPGGYCLDAPLYSPGGSSLMHVEGSVRYVYTRLVRVRE